MAKVSRAGGEVASIPPSLSESQDNENIIFELEENTSVLANISDQFRYSTLHHDDDDGRYGYGHGIAAQCID